MTPNNTTIRRNRVHITPVAAPTKPLIIRTSVLVHPQPLHRRQISSQTKISIDPSNETAQITIKQSTTPAPAPPRKLTITDYNIHERPKRIIRLPSSCTDYDMS